MADKDKLSDQIHTENEDETVVRKTDDASGEDKTRVRRRESPSTEDDDATVVRTRPSAKPDDPDTVSDSRTVIRSSPDARSQEPGGDAQRGDDEPRNENQTVIRAGADRPRVTAPENDSQTVTRSDADREPAAPQNDSQTVIRAGADRPRATPEDNDRQTVIRSDDGREPAAPQDDSQTVIRAGADRPRVTAPENDSETVIRATDDRSVAPAEDSQTVIRSADGRSDPGEDGETAPSSATHSVTVIRSVGKAAEAPAAPSEAPPAPSNDDQTVIADDAIGSDDATIIGGDGSAGALAAAPPADSDATVINPDSEGAPTAVSAPVDDDSTVMSGERADTTYIASRPEDRAPRKGNNESGRLLKNRFVLEEKLGSGGMGDVYKALDLRQQEAQERNPYMAIKLLNETFSKHKDAFISLQREASKTRAMASENIMKVYDFDREGDTFFMAMEILDGEPLDDYLKNHPEGVSQEDAWNIIDGVCEGLKAAHARNIVHSDFKPGNIYYTTDKVAKVFDFGIARAVQNPGTSEEGKEETVFDPGSLGALTPTYASYEMLTGEIPTMSDDVYAVALVAYELFTGKHPYNRVAADKALKRGMEPEPIPFLKRRHWRALKRGLELQSEERTPTIEEFQEGMFSEDLPIFQYSAAAAAAIGIVGFGAYAIWFGGPQEDPALIAEQSTRDLRKADLLELFENPQFNQAWHEDLKKGIAAFDESNGNLVDDFSQESDPELPRYQDRIVQLYVGEAQRLREAYDRENYEYVVANGDVAELAQPNDELDQARSLLDIVRSEFPFDPESLQSAEAILATMLDNRSLRNDNDMTALQATLDSAKAQREADAARKAAEAEALRIKGLYDAESDILATHMKCKGDIKDLDGFQASITSLRDIDGKKFQEGENDLIADLRNCISKKVARTNPERAKAIRDVAMVLFPNMGDIRINPRDPCSRRGLAGNGNNKRRVCRDQLSDGLQGPDLVVIPEDGSIKMFALGRTEIRISDYNAFCQNTGCAQLTGSDRMPATNISIEDARAYLAWLGQQSGRKYRLPTVAEWEYAARTVNDDPIDNNINCTVNTLGVRRGDNLERALSGKTNSWGLYHYVGNAQEWAEENEKLVALGGAHTDPKSSCTVGMRRDHDGTGDAVTGLRVAREIAVQTTTRTRLRARSR